jgi:hypothetical protein
MFVHVHVGDGWMVGGWVVPAKKNRLIATYVIR